MGYHSILGDNDTYKGAFLDVIEEWSQFAGGCNWYTFHPIYMEFEDDRMMGGLEFTLIVLGLGFRVRWNYRVTAQVADIQQSIKDIEAQHKD